MIKSWFTSAWRSLSHGKSFSIVNIAGLTIGIAGATLILLWLQNEISFDKFHKNRDSIFLVYGLTAKIDDKVSTIPVASQALAPTLKKDYPEVLASTRVKDINSFLVTVGNNSFTGMTAALVDEDFLKMFDFPLLQGNNEGQLKNIYSVTITEKMARKLYGDENAIGKIIRLDSVDNFTVTGVLKDLPPNTRFEFDYLISFDYLKKLGKGYSNESWLSNNTPTYIQLKSATNISAFNEKIKNISRKNAGREDIWTHFLFPLQQWHLYAEFDNGIPVGGRIATVRVFASIALFILLIACINFMNLSTARSEKRAKEVGIRKMAGARKSLLIGQFIAEALLITLVSAALALLVVQLVLPYFNTLISTQLKIPYDNIYFWLLTIGFVFLTSLLAGSYPAFYLSSFKPIGIFRKQFKTPQRIISPRKVLVVVQFTFAIILIIATIVVRNQVNHAQDRDRGYSPNNLVQVDFAGDIDKNYLLIKNDLISEGIASSVTKNMSGITQGGSHTWGLRWPGEIPKDTNTTITIYSTDADLVKTAGLKLIAGRDIDIYKYPSDSFSVLLNETAVHVMGFKDPIGQVISTSFDNTQLHVVGVVKDYITGSPFGEIPPTVIQGPGAWFNTIHIKFNPAHSTASNLSKAEKIFKRYNPAYPFDYQFTDQEYARRFDDQQRTKSMAGLFAALAIFISCLGLFALSAFIAETRIKEIGVRKVLGASVTNVATLLSADFIKLVTVSILIATPIAFYAMDKWLQDYVYRITLGWEIFVVAGLVAIFIALLTVSFQSVRAAIANPVKSLRTD